MNSAQSYLLISLSSSIPLEWEILRYKVMTNPADDLPMMEFRSGQELRKWLQSNHASSSGIWLRIYRKSAGIPSVTFEEVLDEGRCYGWSESKRRSHDKISYLQRFTPRKTRGTTSERNLKRAVVLEKEGRMTIAGRKALGAD